MRASGVNVLPRAAQKALQSWERRWRVPGLSANLTVVFSARLRTSLGRATPATGRVVLHESLRHAPTPRLLEVLCHEVAHVAVVRRARSTGAPRPRPHGEEWASLVRAGGYTPATRLAMARPKSREDAATPKARPHRQPAKKVVVHRCPVCHTERIARRLVTRWRCSECVAAGLDGKLEIVRREGPAR